VETPQIYEGDVEGCLDPDGDSLCNGQERDLGTDPAVADSDGDKVTDGQEVMDGTKPLNPDSDGDKLKDGEEKKFGSNPLKADTDGDGLNDKYEMFSGTDPNNPDTDGDGVSDGDEFYKTRTSPTDPKQPAMKKKTKTAALVPSDVGALVANIPSGPMIEAYLFMAVQAHDRFRDLDAAHDWLERALELDPDNAVARGMLERVKAAEQQVGLGRAGVALGVLQQMLLRQALEEERQEQMQHEEHPPGEEWHPPPEEGH
ncbi:MAG: hypothetical protein ACE5H5_07580, partial [Nitrospinota bacterium]